MVMEQAYIKLIFGLKLKQIRTERKLSLFGLSKLSGLSKSYLNEIEKGKKYPKTDKIALLSEKLDVPYDHFVSLKLDKNLAPIGEILQSKVLKEIPLNLFGIQESDLIDIVASAPAKVNAFISTIIEIAEHYSFTKESFYLASVRSFQEANNNYFDELEQQVIDFAEAYQIDLSGSIRSNELEEVLIEEYGYKIDDKQLKNYKELVALRSVFIPKTNTLLLADHIDEAQRLFIYAKELAYNYLSISDRLHTFSWIKFENFDQVLNNFYASYFAGALILSRNSIKEQLQVLFEKETFDANFFVRMVESYNASPDSFYHRLTNILPKDFKIQNLFFLRFTHKTGSGRFHINKELHLTHQHSPHGNETNEIYCRRWMSIKILKEISQSNKNHLFDLQISHYPGDDKSYLIFASATKDPFKENQFRSVSVGLLINKQLKSKIKFLDDPSIKSFDVGVTCERCSIEDCADRLVPPTILEAKIKNKKIEQVVEELNKKFGKKKN